MLKQKYLSVIIPVYNEVNYIQNTLLRVCKADVGKLSKEIILVDDGSTDGTDALIKKIVRQFRSRYLRIIFKTIRHEHNSGKTDAVRSGILQSTGDIVLVQDADLEYDPADYPTLLEPFILYDADVVFGSRFISNRPHRVLYFWHYVVNITLTLLSNMFTNLNVTDMETGYKVFKGVLIRTIILNIASTGFGFEPEITGRIAKIKELKIYEVGISYQGRTYEMGKKIGWKDGMYAIWVIIKTALFA